LEKAPLASRSAKSVDFNQLAQAWTTHVHQNYNEDSNGALKIFYKLPEQLERHYNLWLQSRAERATLENTVEMRTEATHLLTDIGWQAKVLDPIAFSIPSSAKGKQRLVQNIPIQGKKLLLFLLLLSIYSF
jgi:hypothetical protein